MAALERILTPKWFEGVLPHLRQIRDGKHVYHARRPTWPQGLYIQLIDGQWAWSREDWRGGGALSHDALLADDWEVWADTQYMDKERAKAHGY